MIKPTQKAFRAIYNAIPVDNPISRDQLATKTGRDAFTVWCVLAQCRHIGLVDRVPLGWQRNGQDMVEN